MIAALATAAVLVALFILTVGVARHGVRATLLSPLTLVAVLLIGHAAVRPLVLSSDPEAAVLGVWRLGWSENALAEAGWILVVGFGLFGVAFALALRRPAPVTADRAVSGARCLAAAAIGCVLWGALFLRLGGPQALIEDPASLKTGQFGGAYGLAGLAACTAATLLAFDGWLREQKRRMLAVAAICGATALLGSICLATRGPILVTLLGGLLLLGWRRRLRVRQAVVVGLALVVAVVGAQVLRQVREYAQFGTVQEAVSTTLRTDPLALLSADLIEYDHLVALVQLVPDPLARLDGESVAAVPKAFVPRALWADKPRPIDYELSEVLYGPSTLAGTPFTLPGELWWNFGWLGVVLGCPLLGFVFGSAWWRWSGSEGVRAVAVAVAGAYGYLLLTRPLAAMTLTTIIGVGTVLLIAARSRAETALTRVAASPRRPGRALAGPVARKLAPPADPLEK
ncbi:MAG TPA: hypothetical protein VNA28_03775 [Solirubrobacteraceae bacterium]|nr:hypothetical protein [Solirubrobacteraceae bacterium]